MLSCLITLRRMSASLFVSRTLFFRLVRQTLLGPMIMPLLVACGSATQSLSSQSIYGGRPVSPEERLDAVALTDKDGVFCSATALSPTLIITAAHCLTTTPAADVRVYVGPGEAGGMQIGQYEVKQLAINPAYDPSHQDRGFDSAYLILKVPLDLPATTYVPILVDADERNELLRGGSDSYLVGFGWSKKHVLGVKTETKATVRKLYNVEAEIGGKGRDACQGDSGGPAYGLLKSGEWRLYGITSRGSDCGNGGVWGLIGEKGNICWIKNASQAQDLELPPHYCDDFKG